MNRIVLGALIALALTGLGLFWWQGQGGSGTRSAATAALREASDRIFRILPASDPGDMVGPAPPAGDRAYQASSAASSVMTVIATGASRATEMLSSRTEAFRKLDKRRQQSARPSKNGRLPRWTEIRMLRMPNGDNELTPAEFATTAAQTEEENRAAAC